MSPTKLETLGFRPSPVGVAMSEAPTPLAAAQRKVAGLCNKIWYLFKFSVMSLQCSLPYVFCYYSEKIHNV